MGATLVTKDNAPQDQPVKGILYLTTVVLVAPGAVFALFYTDPAQGPSMDTASVSTVSQDVFKPGVNIAVGTHSTQRGTADVTLDADTVVIRDIDPDRIQDHRWVVSGVEAGQDHTTVFGIIPSSNSAQTTDFSTIYAAKGDTPRVYTANVNSALGMARSTRKAAIEGLEIFRLDSQWAVIMITASPPTPSTMQVIVRPSTQPEGTDTLAVTVFDVSIRDANRGQ